MTTPGTFTLQKTDSKTSARRGCLWTAHGPVETPVFMPVGTQGTVKAMSPNELREIDTRIILGNTYHLFIRPGMDVIDKCGGLHSFISWDRPILTDSGGFQVFSLSPLRKIQADGVEFASHVDGTRFFMGPVEAMSIQRRLGSDIAMAFDECPPHTSTYEYTCQAVGRTLSWAALCLSQKRAPDQLYFGIVQGGAFQDLRKRCAAELASMGFDGYAIGGVSVGEPPGEMIQAIDYSISAMPEERPRYLMGVGERWQIVEAVARGVDMFDCVMPTRLARNGTAFTARGKYPIKAGEYKEDTRPLEEGCRCEACMNFSRAYIRHLFNVGEILGVRLITLHNLHCYMRFMEELREMIVSGCFDEFRKEFMALSANGKDSVI